ncbi:16S rRNA (guanine(966)-N(2))-methyltransferase RsmD [Faecalibacter rhinopitheci]|uniref:16S rRNA (Guanine(966)-N(2))-methyltransferase RsmD n=1 Tax=Faecalibacter rhinopitheci TaxID=2779678 RepID=A0A8J7FQW6_9FLAO|nr:16S rRNA (guanine(966)-N(2))-methyltransferase RsmD [Faecalibacter rhinopitheci]MBF0596728.1 16S rRNA (guanine(966)-N(2))-methyltransferase RsmD [Faecalibacter rhinopitheci]MBQ0148832.1 16S rRNA (guanine(966)-N(2))-methyltransferase RsmD [Candidatus Onthonaster equi]
MRIISGSLKGKRITAPTNLPVRPTTDFAKEALFNILNNQWYFDEITVLDLFSGIGSISLEFASRGAKKVTSVDSFTGCIKFLDETAKKLELDNIINTQKADAIKYVAKKAIKGYDIVFADPPYDLSAEDYEKLLNGILENEWLEEGGNFVLEHPDSIKFENHPRFVQHKKYGNVHFSFFE